MLSSPFQFDIGAYQILLPEHATISAAVQMPGPGSIISAWTQWTVSIGRFQIFVHLDARNELTDLKRFIDHTTKSDVITPSITVNGIPGVTHGSYGPLRTWIDWWFKKGDTMLCFCLQSKSFPVTAPIEAEIAEHDEIVGSLKYRPDLYSKIQ